MGLLNFSINGKNSYEDFGWIIKESNHENIAAKRYESKVVPGRTGNLIIEQNAKDNKIIDIEAVVKLGSANAQLYGIRLREWLQGFQGYGHLIFDDGYQFEAILKGEVDIKRGPCNTRTIKLQFEAVPIDPNSYKYVLGDTQRKILLTDDTKGIEVN